MRHYRLLILAVLLTFVGRAIADNLTVETVMLNAGDTKQMIIGLNNPTNKYAAFQFDLVLPEGVSIAKNDNGKFIASLNEDRKDDHTLTVSDMGNNIYRFLTFSMTNAEFYGKAGALVNLTLRADDGISEGNKTATIQSQVFTEVNGTQYKWSDINFTIKVSVEISITAPTAKTGLVYTGSAQELITAGSSSAGEMQYSLDGSNYSTTIPKGTDAKTYTVYYKVKGDANHSDTAPSTLAATITKAPLTITAKSYTIKQGEDLPTFEATYSGFKNNENSSVLTALPTFYCSATSESVPGTYDITVSDAVAANYDITYVKGTLTVTPGTYTLTYIVDGEVYKTVSYEYGTTITPEVAPTKEGYTFSGWSEIPATMPAKNVTVTGSFTINKYKLIYKVDGVEYKTYEVEYGAMITPEAEPTKEGYTFSGWSEIPETMPAHDVTVTGSFTINKYKLTYMVDGVEYKSYEIEYGAKITPEAEPTMEGHTFSGWSEIPSTMPAKDVIVTGTFSANKYKLTYKVDGVEYKTYELEYGATITPEAEPSKEGYTFSGWSEIPETMPAHDVTITGTFSKGSYKLTYIVDGEVYKIVSYEYGAKITPEAEPTKDGHTFSGWSEIPSTMPAKDVIVTGTFTANKYMLIYMVDGVVYKTVSYDFGATITPEAEPTKEGYTFLGWSEIPSTMPAHDVTVTGSFTINKYKLIYKVDGVDYKSYEIEFGAKITPEAKPTKEGFTFSGWSEIPETMPAHDVTVTGSFIINKYKLTYKVDGVEYKSFEVEFGAKITPEAKPTKEGFTFSGWSEIPETMPAHDVTVTGSFTINKYKLIYMVDGAEYKSFEIEFGAKITPEAKPTKEGYTFSGWSEIPETMPAHDVTVTGTFTINKYKLVYKVDGKEYKSYEVEFGAKITPEPEPTKEGYTFSGWSEIPKTMPAKDVTVTGTFTKGAYKLIYMVDGEVYKTVNYDYGANITPEPEPTKEGYAFSGWSEIPKTMPAKDVTVTGTFTINKYKLVYKVDGKEYKSYEIEYGAKITPEAEPTKEGYTFSGWSEIPKTMPAKDVTVTGTFTINKYKLVYKVDGKEYKSYEVEFGAKITPEPAPTKEGYTFSGWSEIPKTMPAKDVTVTGTFSINKYKLVYKVDGVEYKSYEIEFGATITPEAEPTKEGYTFSGWSEIPKTMPAKDVTVTGTFTINKYKLTYKVDGKVYKSYDIEFGTKITPEPEPTKEGYTFSGWSEIPKTMPAKDVTVTGTFTINKYKLTYKVDGKVYKSYDIEFGAKITPEPEPIKEGYTFSGWSEIPETMPAYDVTVTGTFTQVEYNVDDLIYDITGEGTVTIKGGKHKGEVILEATVVINGRTYQVTAIAEGAFQGCTELTSIVIPNSITTIGAKAFEGCSLLHLIKIGKGIKEIGSKAFANIFQHHARTRAEDDGLKVYCEAEAIPSTAADAFENSPIGQGTLIVADELVNVYKVVMPWNGFGSVIGLTTDIRSIDIDSENALIFDMQGNRLDNIRKGVNIIRTRDGKTKKVMVK